MKVLVDYENLLRSYVIDENVIYGTNLYGTQGFCLVDNGIIRKIYFDSKHMQKVYDFSRYKSNKIAFPFYYLYDSLDDLQIVGEVMPYYDKEAITTSLNEACSIDKFIKHYRAMLAEIAKFPEIRMNDVCTPNILYHDEQGFTLIDTTDWQISDMNDYTKINQQVFCSRVNEILMGELMGIYPMILCNGNFRANLLKYGKNGEELFKALWATTENNSHIIEVLEMYKMMFGYRNYPVKTIEDVIKYTKKLKK